MRPIDADALKEALKEPISMDKEKAEALWEGWHECTIAVDKAIDNASTIEPETRTGEWIVETIRSNWDEWDNCTCTTCGTVFKRFSPKRKYCPECGSYNGGKRDENRVQDF